MWILAASAFGAPEYAVSLPRRPSTLPQNDVRITVNGTVGVASDPTTADLVAGAAVGITDQFEVGAWLVPLTLAPKVGYIDPSLYVAYGGALSKKTTLTPMLRLYVPVTSASSALLDAQLKLGVQIGKDALLTAAPTATLHFVQGGPNTGVGAPVSLLVQPSRRFFFEVESGLGTDPFDWRYEAVRPANTDLAVPAGLRIGGVAGKLKSGAIVDLSAGAYWPALVNGGSVAADNVLVVAEISTNLLSDKPKKGKGKGKGKGKKGGGKRR